MNITKKDVLSIKAIAIIVIAIHNIVRRTNDIRCNEFCFDVDNSTAFVENVFQSLLSFFIQSFGYLGWVGVPVFVFFSGYGLSMKYSNLNDGAKKIITSNLKKIMCLFYPAFAIAWITLFLCNGIAPGCGKYMIITALEQTLFIKNILDPYNFEPDAFWFFGMILQLYLFFPLLRKLKTEMLIVFASAFFFITIIVCANTNDYFFRKNCFGWIYLFISGIICSRIKFDIHKVNSNVMLVVGFVSCVLIYLTSCDKWLWVFGDLLSVISMTSFGIVCINRWLIHLGAVSSSIFVMHGIVTYVFFAFVYEGKFYNENYIMSILLYLVAVYLSALLYDKIYKTILNFFRLNSASSENPTNRV